MRESFRAQAGITALHGTRRGHITQVDSVRSLVTYLDNHERTWVNNDELAPDISVDTSPAPPRTRLTEASDTERELALRRHNAVKAYKALPRREQTRTKAEEIAREQGMSVASLYKWRKIHNGTLDSVLRRPDPRKGYIDPDDPVEVVIREVLDDLETSKSEDPGGLRFNYRGIVSRVHRKCADLGLLPKGEHTIRRRIHARFSTLERKKRTTGAQEASKYESHPGHFPDAPHPYSVIQIDHTLLNVIVVDDQLRQPIGRPWVTLAIDVYSRCIAAFRVSLDPPSAAMVGLVITRAVLPKKPWLTALDPELGQYFLSIYGAPGTFHADNASDFRCKTISDATKRFEWELDWRAVGRTEWGGHVEALAGGLKKRLLIVPGATKRTGKFPRQYEKNKDKYAQYTVDELERHLAHELYGKYHYEWHEGIRDIPVERYKDGLRKGPGAPEVIRGTKARDIELSYLPSFTAKVQKDGVTQYHVTWWSTACEEIVAHFGTGSGKSYETDFHFMPEGMKTIYFSHPLRNEWVTAQYPLHEPDYALWELKAANKAKAEERRQKEGLPTTQEAIFRSAASQRQIHEGAAVASKTARRLAQRQREDEKKRRAAKSSPPSAKAELPPPPPPTVVEEDDVLPPSGRAAVRF